MAHSKTAQKRVRQNRARRLRTEVKQLRAAIAAGMTEDVEKRLPRTCAMLDRMAGRGILHRNAAARTKSRLARLAAR